MEVEARLALRTAEERAGAIAGRAESLRRQASSERQARARAAARGRPGSGRAHRRDRGRGAGERAGAAIAESLAAAAAPSGTPRPRSAPSGNARWPRCAPTTRGSPRCWRSSSTPCTATRCCGRSRGLRLEALTAKVLDDHGLAADDLVDEYGPHVPVPASAAETAEYEAARERGDEVGAAADALTTAPPRSAGPPARRRTSGCWAG